MTITDTRPTTTGQRDRSPSFPFIPLKVAIERLTAFEEHHKRAPVPPDRVGSAWDMKPNSSQAAQTIAALKAFGLLETQRGDSGRALVVSDDGRTFLRAQQDSIKQDVLRRAALRPRQIETYWRDWGSDRPADAACLDQLVLRGGFSRDGADKFLRVYDATIAFAGLAESNKIPTDHGDEGDEDANGRAKEHSKEPPSRRVRLYDVNVGDYAQWTSGGVDQFKPPRRVTRVEGEYAFVHGSLTGIPMAELTVVDPPAIAPPSMVSKRSTTGRDPVIDANLRLSSGGSRLQITADVDLDGLKKLRDMLDKYEEILRLLTTPVDQLPDGPPEDHEA
jgi:hypothetical protein